MGCLPDPQKEPFLQPLKGFPISVLHPRLARWHPTRFHICFGQRRRIPGRILAQKLQQLALLFSSSGPRRGTEEYAKWHHLAIRQLDPFVLDRLVDPGPPGAGADWLVLADTNGGMIPEKIREIIAKVINEVKTPLGIHAHNDSECGVANSIEAVKSGVLQVQGTINGIGERCGNANLCSIIPNLYFKMNCVFEKIGEKELKRLTEISHYVYELANLTPDNRQPYTGMSAFTHKAGVHANAVEKNPRTYEHVNPESVGNKRRILISEQAGKSNIIEKAKEMGINIPKNFVPVVVDKVKELENLGYEFEGADASFELLVKNICGQFKEKFSVESFKTLIYYSGSKSVIEATVKIKVGELEQLTVAEGDGPVNALDIALRNALSVFYPAVKGVKLLDYKVRILNPKAGTAAITRVLVSFRYDGIEWGTVGVSGNIIEASWQALLDSMNYLLMKLETDEKLIFEER